MKITQTRPNAFVFSFTPDELANMEQTLDDYREAIGETLVEMIKNRLDWVDLEGEHD